MKEFGYKDYLTTLLLVILAFNYVDRQALGVVLQDIKVDLTLSDTQLGLLSGIAFALFYSVLGIPIARWADRGNRVAIISITTALWSVAVACCGMAGSFLQLLLIRVGVAVGESGCMPPAHSLIADHFTRTERPRAVARYMLGVPISVVLGYLGAGWLNEFFGWRATFIMLGAPGLALAVLSWLTLKEPRQGRPEIPLPSVSAMSLGEVCLALWANKTFRHLLLCYSVLSFFNQGIWQWLPTFVLRSYGLQTGELGTWFAIVCGLAGVLGTYGGGELATRFAADNERLQLKAMAVAFSAFSLVMAAVYLSSSLYISFGLIGLASAGGAMTNGPLFATIQTVVPQQMRAQSIALIYLFANLIGMGLGPLAAGMLSDAFRSWAGEESLRYALLALCPGYFWGGWHLWRASKTVVCDLTTLQPCPQRPTYRPGK
jgi:MFS family permease